MKSIYFMILIMLVSACQDKMYRTVVPATRKQIKMNPYGAYVELTPVSGEMKIGEALTLVNDTLYMLGGFGVIKTPVNEVKSAQLILTRNAAGNYMKFAALLCIPAMLGVITHPDYGQNFALVGLVILGTGGIAAAIESSRKSEILTYPGDLSNVAEIQNYCRFPGGIPIDLEISSFKGHLETK
ncbi:MAG: hypothetical protein RLQ12_03370 [Cyclobacteriaceae bacterium]